MLHHCERSELKNEEKGAKIRKPSQLGNIVKNETF